MNFNLNLHLKNSKVIIIGATNHPWDLDEAILSRFQKKLYVPPPDEKSRARIFELHLRGAELDDITEEALARMSDGYSGREIAAICRDAIMYMVREMNPDFKSVDPKLLEKYSLKERPIKKSDFEKAFEKNKRMADPSFMKKYEDWGKNDQS